MPLLNRPVEIAIRSLVAFDERPVNLGDVADSMKGMVRERADITESAQITRGHPCCLSDVLAGRIWGFSVGAECLLHVRDDLLRVGPVEPLVVSAETTDGQRVRSRL